MRESSKKKKQTVRIVKSKDPEALRLIMEIAEIEELIEKRNLPVSLDHRDRLLPVLVAERDKRLAELREFLRG